MINLGGGVISDIGGFSANTFNRGIDFVNIPTTLLSQVDSSIGGKTGVNTNLGKNLIGTFYQPKLVISDINFLQSLPEREKICGYGEILKHSLIDNKNFFIFLYLKYRALDSKFLFLNTTFELIDSVKILRLFLTEENSF